VSKPLSRAQREAKRVELTGRLRRRLAETVEAIDAAIDAWEAVGRVAEALADLDEPQATEGVSGTKMRVSRRRELR